MPLGNLSSGEYSIKLVLVSDRFDGAVNYYDTIQEVGQFTIVDDPQQTFGFYWHESVFGNMRMAPMEIF